MINRQAFEEMLKKHIGQMEESVTVELHLFNGELLFLQSSIEHYEGYFVGSVFPNKPLDPNKINQEIPKNQNGQRVFDRLIISYEAISYVRITADRPQTTSPLGFVS